MKIGCFGDDFFYSQLIFCLCRFTVEEFPPANYAAISANIALAGVAGGHEKYDLFLRYGLPPTPVQYSVNGEEH